MARIAFRPPVTKKLLAFQAPKPAGDRSTFRVTSPFGPRSDGFHGGLDMGDYGSGAAVVAAAHGRVIATGPLRGPWSTPTNRWPSGNYGGLMVVIEHAPGVASIYAHLGTLRVTALTGMDVPAGYTLGTVGDTGSAAGQAHLHFGIQAPAASVPPGVQTRRTSAGYGLDVDPWPLLTGRAILSVEDDVKLPVGLSSLTFAELGVGNRLRTHPSTTDGSRITDQIERVQVFGEVDSEPWSVGGKSGTTWYYIGLGLDTWYVAKALLPNVRLTPLGTATVPVAAADCLEQERALDQAQNKLARARTSAQGAAQAATATVEALR